MNALGHAAMFMSFSSLSLFALPGTTTGKNIHNSLKITAAAARPTCDVCTQWYELVTAGQRNIAYKYYMVHAELLQCEEARPRSNRWGRCSVSSSSY